MSKEYNSFLQEKLEQFLTGHHLSQAKAASMIGISQTALSQYRRSMYDNGNVIELESKLEEFFRAQDERRAASEKARPYRPIQGYVPTSISEDAYKLIRYCQLEKGMVIIHGDAGIGKTKAAGKFERDNPNATLYIESSPATGSLRGVLKQLARALKVSDRLNNGDMAFEVKEKLQEGNKIVIIDEAQHLTYKALEQISRWTDPDRLTGKCHIAIVLMGNSEIYHRMLGRQEALFAQQFSRVKLNRLYRTQNTTMEDVKSLFPLLEEKRAKKEQEFLMGICQSKWGIRGAVNVYNNATNNEDVSYSGLYSMARNMGIGLL